MCCIILTLVRGAAKGTCYIYKPGNFSSSRGCADLFHIFLTTMRDFNEIQRNILLIMIICEILQFILICIIWELKSNIGGKEAFKKSYYYVS